MEITFPFDRITWYFSKGGGSDRVPKSLGPINYWDMGSTAFLTETPTVSHLFQHKPVTQQDLAGIFDHVVILTNPLFEKWKRPNNRPLIYYT
jgi:hypothetical protein